jgi:hypothetical protein
MSNDQNHATETSTDPGERSGNPVKEMFLLAALYLPMGFFLWFFAASLLMLPARILSQFVLTTLHGGIFERIFQLDFYFEIQTSIQLPNPESGGEAGMMDWNINPMLYAWGMALLFGLIMATPMSIKRRVMQMVIGYSTVTLVTLWGVYWEIWKDMAFRWSQQFPAQVGPLVDAVAYSPTMIALCYQLGYLMLPAVVPIATWILMNRRFIETEVVRHKL